MDDLARLTNRQIDDLYFHPRDEKTGAIAVKNETPEKGMAVFTAVPDLRTELANLYKVADALRLPAEARAEAEKKLRAKFQAREDT